MRFLTLALLLSLLLAPAVVAEPSIDSKIAPELLVQLDQDLFKAHAEGVAAPVYLNATHIETLAIIPLENLEAHAIDVA